MPCISRSFNACTNLSALFLFCTLARRNALAQAKPSAPARTASPDPASLPAHDSHQGLVIAADPYISAERYKDKFGKHTPVRRRHHRDRSFLPQRQRLADPRQPEDHATARRRAGRIPPAARPAFARRRGRSRPGETAKGSNAPISRSAHRCAAQPTRQKLGGVRRGRAFGGPEHGFASSSCHDARLRLLRYRRALRLDLERALRGARPCFHERHRSLYFSSRSIWVLATH